MLGLAMVVVVGSFDAVDGGFLARTQVPVVHRTIEVFASAQSGPVVVSDGDAPQTRFPIVIEAGSAPSLTDSGLIIDGTSLELTEPLTLQLRRAGSLSLALGQPVTRRVGSKLYVDLPRASFALIPSTPFEELDGGVVRVVDPSASIDVQLQVSGPPMPWPVLSAYQSWGAGMVWDAARARITRFGGGDALDLEEGTSIWDPIAGWQVLPVASPPPRVRASLVYDSARQRVVLFGGLGANGLRADTWEFDGTQWSEVTPATGPSPRWSHGAAFDEDTGQMILFGGLAGSDASNLELGDTWSWDGFSWTQLQPAMSPSARDAFGMTWDGTRRRVTLAAGWDGTTMLADAWAWVGGTWQSLAALPSPRTSTALVWSPVSHDLLLVGGSDPRGGPLYFSSTFRFDGTAWSAGPQLAQPAARVALVGHPTMGAIMHGGKNGTGFAFDTALLEPTWQRLAQGDRAERTLTNGFTVVGERYVWRASINGSTGQPGPFVPVFHIPLGTRVMGMASYTNLYGVLDGGMIGWNVNFPGGAVIRSPPPFQAIGGELNFDWVLDLDGGFHEVRSDSAWHFVSTAPVEFRGLHARVQSRVEFLAWTDRLNIWTPHDGGLRTFGAPLAIDGGVYLLPTASTAIATEARGSWHLADTGLWIYFGLPSLDEPPIDGVVITDAGLAEYQYYKPLGARCERGDECARGQCVDGRCCNGTCPSCAVCSIEAGGLVDGECSPAPAGTFCFDAGCGVQTCDGVSSSCNVPPDFCGVDAGVEPEFDAGPPRPDGGMTQQPEPEPEPSGCGCDASPVGLGLTFVLCLQRLRSRRRRQLISDLVRELTASSHA